MTTRVWLWVFMMLALVAAGTPARAQELLINRSFEAPVTPANGNNFYTTIPNWTATNVTPANPQPYNVVRPHTGYAGNPTAPPAGGGVQYFDVNAAAGSMNQTVTIASTGMVDFSGWFSVRDNQQALSGLTINIRDATNAIVGTATTSFLATDPIGLWKQVSGTNIPVAAGTYTFEAVIPNPANFDLAGLVFKPALTLSKSSVAYSDPQSGTANPKLIPGGVAQYTISATSPASYTITNDSITLVDTTPTNSALVVTDIGGAGSGPAAFTAGTSGLTYAFTSLASTTDDIEFSNNGGATYTYAPVADANGADSAVTHLRLRPKGTMAASSSFSFALRYRVN